MLFIAGGVYLTNFHPLIFISRGSDQQLFTLPKIDKQYVQISTFTAQGHYAGCGIRVDSSMIIGKDSDCLPLQIAFE